MRRPVFLIALLIILTSLHAYGEQGCYTIVAGKSATADGSVLLGHNEDNGIRNVAGLVRVARGAHDGNERVTFPGGGGIPQGDTTFAYLRLQMPEREHSDAFLNEFGVAVVSNNCPSREDRSDFIDGGIGGPLLRRIVAERARTAREGVRLIGSLIEHFGYTASGRTMVICDPAEGWLVAMVQGRHWVAQRVPDNCVAMIANTYSIRAVDLADTLNFLGSPDLISYAVGRGWHDPDKGIFSFEASYADPETRVSPSNTHRHWSGLRRLSAVELPLPEEARLPFAVTPGKKLTVGDLTPVLRDHYENSPYKNDSSGSISPHKAHAATICGPYTNSSSVFQLRGGMPVDIGAVWWLALWQPCSSPYLPLYIGLRKVPGVYGFGSPYAGEGIPVGAEAPDFGEAYRSLGDLARWVDGDYDSRIGPVRAAWRTVEEDCYGYQQDFESLLAGQWRRYPDRSREMFESYCRGVVLRAVRRARDFTE